MPDATEWTGPDGIIRRKRADGTTGFRWTWREGGTRDGVRRSFTRDKLGDAKALRAAVIANGYRLPEDLDSTLPVGAPGARIRFDAGPLFGDYGRERIKLRTGIGIGQRNALERDLERHMIPAFGALPLTALDEELVSGWVLGMEEGTHSWLRGRPLAPRTRRRLLTQAGAIMNVAVKKKLVADNPFKDVRIGREDHDRFEEQVVLDPDEWQLLRGHLPAGVARALPDLLIGTGARWGEGTALAVGHVDVGARTVRIARSWQDDGKGHAQLGPTKSRKSRRTIDVGARTLESIEELLTGRAAQDLLFVGRQGGRVRASNYWTRVWTPAVARAQADGLTKKPRIHDLRHTHVSWLIAANVPIAVIQRRLGHESITTTIDTYGHMLPSTGAAAVDAIDEALGDL